MDEVNIQSVDLGQELGETIEFRLESAPVVLSPPVVDERFCIRQADTLRPVGDGFRIGQRVLASRGFRSSISESGIATVKGRTEV